MTEIQAIGWDIDTAPSGMTQVKSVRINDLKVTTPADSIVVVGFGVLDGMVSGSATLVGGATTAEWVAGDCIVTFNGTEDESTPVDVIFVPEALTGDEYFFISVGGSPGDSVPDAITFSSLVWTWE